MPLKRIPILTYHAVEEVASPLFTPPSVFESHLASLATAGYQAVSLATLLAWLKEPAHLLPARPVAFTFDDGYASVYTTAWPRLQAHGFSATVFLVTGYCGRDNRWPGQPAGMPVRPLLTWEQAGRLAAAGWELGAHTRSHAPLPALGLDQAEEEIAASQQAIQVHTGHPARVFAYPYGATNPAVAGLVRRYFDGAASVRLGLVSAGSEPYALSRLDAYYFRPGLAPHLDRPLFHHYLRLRQGLRAARRRWRPDWDSRLSPHASQ
ncbi:MAG: polysaccharide deacetylase family protein [Chloroflexi bacterium]|nr:polysaccharide deacetylase family protein [Chloroflexota bacterium]